VPRPRLPDSTFWVEPEAVDLQHLRLSADESHHLLRVHRAREGTPFQATDGRGGFFECVLESVEDGEAVGRIVRSRERHGELGHSIELLVGLPEWSAAEQVVEHGVPLGALLLDFVPCERSGHEGPGAVRLGRLERLARAGLKQSRRSVMPRILSSRSLPDSVRSLEPGQRFMADQEGDLFAPRVQEDPQLAVQLAVGPPGGFTEEERGFLRAEGFAPISLGPSRLTTETASVALISLVRNSLLRTKL
jgi:16S rRNA (uracil1498-N3)-methyltransferase